MRHQNYSLFRIDRVDDAICSFGGREYKLTADCILLIEGLCFYVVQIKGCICSTVGCSCAYRISIEFERELGVYDSSQ